VALSAAPEVLATVKGQRSLRLPDPIEWDGKQSLTVSTEAGAVELSWLAIGPEREWTASGTARPAAAAPRR
jgi:hypothetical protein